MTVKEVECLFMKYTREVVDNLDSGINEPPHRPYGYLLKRCTCDNCMKEKEEKRKYDSSNQKNQKD